jgi:hypothetical protein
MKGTSAMVVLGLMSALVGFMLLVAGRRLTLRSSGGRPRSAG